MTKISLDVENLDDPKKCPCRKCFDYRKELEQKELNKTLKREPNNLSEALLGPVETTLRWKKMAGLEKKIEIHDCHLSPDSGCPCGEWREELDQLRSEEPFLKT